MTYNVFGGMLNLVQPSSLYSTSCCSNNTSCCSNTKYLSTFYSIFFCICIFAFSFSLLALEEDDISNELIQNERS